MDQEIIDLLNTLNETINKLTELLGGETDVEEEGQVEEEPIEEEIVEEEIVEEEPEADQPDGGSLTWRGDRRPGTVKPNRKIDKLDVRPAPRPLIGQ